MNNIPQTLTLRGILNKENCLYQQQINALSAQITDHITIERHLQLLHEISVLQHRINVRLNRQTKQAKPHISHQLIK